jgi:hypothetical protein
MLTVGLGDVLDTGVFEGEGFGVAVDVLGVGVGDEDPPPCAGGKVVEVEPDSRRSLLVRVVENELATTINEFITKTERDVKIAKYTTISTRLYPFCLFFLI